jgi:hypothetical protein
MGLINVVTNEVKAAVGYQQEFEELLNNSDVVRALRLMHDHSAEAKANLDLYNVDSHKIMNRQDRAVFDKKGNFVRWSKRWKIPIPWHEYINEVALVFLYGRPVKWRQLSERKEGEFDAYDAYIKLLDKTRFNALVREAKRAAGAEGISAMIYHLYQENGEAKLRMKVLSQEKGDDIYTIKDQYGRLKAAGWGYTLTDIGGRSVYHVDIDTGEHIYRCKRANIGWEVKVEDNPVGKILFLIFEQKPEAAAVQAMTERYENLGSVDSDVNDRFSNPAMVATAEVLNSLPKQEDEAKLFILKSGGKMEYLTWDQASQSKENEYKRLEKHILSKSFTPDIDFENMKGLGNMSAKAIRKVLLLAVIKAERHKEKHDDYMNRHAHLILAIMGNVLDYKHKRYYDELQLGHEFQEPFGDDVSEQLSDALKQFGQGGLSLATLLEISYLVKNAKKELEQIEKERAEDMERQKELNKMDVFGEAE